MVASASHRGLSQIQRLCSRRARRCADQRAEAEEEGADLVRPDDAAFFGEAAPRALPDFGRASGAIPFCSSNCFNQAWMYRGSSGQSCSSKRRFFALNSTRVFGITPPQTPPTERVRRQGNRVNGKERLEIPGELMQRAKAKTPPLRRRGSLSARSLGTLQLQDARTGREFKRKCKKKMLGGGPAGNGGG